MRVIARGEAERQRVDMRRGAISVRQNIDIIMRYERADACVHTMTSRYLRLLPVCRRRSTRYHMLLPAEKERCRRQRRVERCRRRATIRAICARASAERYARERVMMTLWRARCYARYYTR